MEPVDFPALLERGGIGSAIKVARQTFYSREARALMSRLLDEERPDIVHLQNIHHHLTPSVIEAAASRRIPVVWTLHDYSVICPNGNLWSRGKPCEECRNVRFHRAIVNRCKRGSLAASSMAALESASHRLLGMFGRVSLYIAPSRFLEAKVREFGFFPSRLAHLDNFLRPPAGPAPYRSDGHLLFAGRLIHDKGIATLLQAARLWGPKRLVIAGEGPLLPMVRDACAASPHITYAGQLGSEDLAGMIETSSGVLVPSVWYENQPYAALEAFSAGRPVIASNQGALPELVGDEERGLLFNAGDADDLARKVTALTSSPSRAAEMGENGARLVRERFTPQRHYEGLMRLYDRARTEAYGRAA
jgi:glycosyltransferase involved in cell wall biosynthesis